MKVIYLILNVFYITLIHSKLTNLKSQYLSNLHDPVKVVISGYGGTRSHFQSLLTIGNHLGTMNPQNEIYFATHSDRLYFADNLETIQPYDLGSVEGVTKLPTRQFSDFLVPLYDHLFDRYDEMVHTLNPDIIICDFFATACMDIAQKYKIPLIVGFQTLEVGLSEHPYLTAKYNNGVSLKIKDLNIFQRWYNYYIAPMEWKYEMKGLMDELNKLRVKYHIPKDDEPFGKIKNVLKLANTFIGWEISRAFDPSIKFIGPMIGSQNSTLSEDFDQFLEGKERVIFMAFGTRRSMLEAHQLQLIVQSALNLIGSNTVDGVIFSTKTTQDRYPQGFTLDSRLLSQQDLFDENISKIKFVPFAPQQALLNQKKIHLFINHGGIESIFEGIYSLTPMLVIPSVGDQPTNALHVQRLHMGFKIDKHSDTIEDVVDKMTQVLEDKDQKFSNGLIQFRTLIEYHQLGIQEGAQLILSQIKLSKLCRGKENNNDDTIPCEMKYLANEYESLPYFVKSQWDIHLLTLSVGLIVLSITVKLYQNIQSKHIDSKVKNQ